MLRNNREYNQTRPITIETNYTQNADGSVLISFGNTRVICTAFLEERVPSFLRNQKRGWVTGEYGMLPGSTHSRSSREAAKGRQSGRTVEISRLIGRSLRTCVSDIRLGEVTITVDCDVIQADGGTRTASITGGYVALALCLWRKRELFTARPLVGSVSAISLGVKDGKVMVDLDYQEDSNMDVDLNLVMNGEGRFVEIQGTAEHSPFSRDELIEILDMGGNALNEVAALQRKALIDAGVDEKWL